MLAEFILSIERIYISITFLILPTIISIKLERLRDRRSITIVFLSNLLYFIIKVSNSFSKELVVTIVRQIYFLRTRALEEDSSA